MKQDVQGALGVFGVKKKGEPTVKGWKPAPQSGNRRPEILLKDPGTRNIAYLVETVLKSHRFLMAAL